jgi:hypothetical protein
MCALTHRAIVGRVYASIIKGEMMMSEKVDRLFLKPFCFECGKVRSEIDFDAVGDDAFRGRDGQELRVFTGLSDVAMEELLEKFGFESDPVEVPLIVTYDGAVIHKAKNVIMHLRRNGMVRQ